MLADLVRVFIAAFVAGIGFSTAVGGMILAVGVWIK